MSYTPPFVAQIENDRPFLDDHLVRVYALHPDLPTDELPPLDPLLAVMRSTHLDQVLRLVSGAYWATVYARRAFRRALEFRGRLDLRIGRPLALVRRRVLADTIAAIGREVARFRADASGRLSAGVCSGLQPPQRATT
ncbi:hypothetical protein FRC10_000607 [Ceratobasidium sp. 414]|nr:hypothetical protein FRC10_000607 [Ceratobasidium sp. 414]